MQFALEVARHVVFVTRLDLKLRVKYLLHGQRRKTSLLGPFKLLGGIPTAMTSQGLQCMLNHWLPQFIELMGGSHCRLLLVALARVFEGST